MTEKENCCVSHLKKRELKYEDISKNCNCSYKTVIRAAKKNDLSYGQGIKHYWTFDGPSVEMSYVIGAYLTDGCVPKNRSRFIFTNTDKDYANMVHECLLSIGAPSVMYEKPPAKPGYKTQYFVYSYSKIFCNFLVDCTISKSIIPHFIIDGNKETKLSLIASVIDGDGHVRIDGSIGVRGTCEFLFDFNNMLNSIGVRTNGIRVESILDSGLEYRSLSIKRSDFLSVGGYCIIKRKMERVVSAKDTRIRHRKPHEKFLCPVCGEIEKSKNAQMCRSCYSKSEKLIERLRLQSSSAGIAGCKARWS